MYPFEVWNEEEQRLEFDDYEWTEFGKELFRQYPQEIYRPRCLITLSNPANSLSEFQYVDGVSGEDLFRNVNFSHHSSDWSSIFETYPAYYMNGQRSGLRFFIETGHQNPWGDSLQIIAESNNIFDDDNLLAPIIKVAYFRNQFWKVDQLLNNMLIYQDPPTNAELLQMVGRATRDGNVMPHNERTRSSEAVNWRDQGF